MTAPATTNGPAETMKALTLPPDLAEALGPEVARAKLLSARHVAELLAISERAVWMLEATGELPPAIRLTPRLVRWRLADLIAAIERRSPAPDGDPPR